MRIYSYSIEEGFDGKFAICPWIIDISSTRKCGDMVLGDANFAVLERETFVNGSPGFCLYGSTQDWTAPVQITTPQHAEHFAIISPDGRFKPDSTFVWRNFDMTTGDVYDSMLKKGREKEFRLEDQEWMRFSDDCPAVVINNICFPSNDSWLFRAIDSGDAEEIADMVYRGDARDFEPQIEVPRLKSVEELTREFPKMKNLYRMFEERLDSKDYEFTLDFTQRSKNERCRKNTERELR